MANQLPSIIPIALSVVTGGIKQKEDSNQRAQIEAQAALDNERRQKALKSAVATQRARFGAAGVDGNDGSAEAVLLGLFQSSEEEAQARLERDALRIKATSLGTSGSGRNLLDLTETVFRNDFIANFGRAD